MNFHVSPSIIVQGITGSHGSFHTKQMLDYGTKIVAGVTPGKGGEVTHGIPVYNSVKEALKKHMASWSCLFVPAVNLTSAALEALEEGLNLVIITEHAPVHDTVRILRRARAINRLVIGPNCPGFAVPGKYKIGIMPSHIFLSVKHDRENGIGIISRSGTLTYEIVSLLTHVGFPQSFVIGIGGDALSGLDFTDALEIFRGDPRIEKIVLIGEIGGDAEERAASFVTDTKFKIPIVAFLAGREAPEGKVMGHAGALVSGDFGTYRSKKEALEKAGIQVAEKPSDIVKILAGLELP